jgi:PPM family protein phosphatase
MDQKKSIWAHCLQYAAKSDVGLRRANNQDSLAVSLAGNQQAWFQRGHLFLVADGMGAHAAGELASGIAAGAVPLTYDKLNDRPASQSLHEAVIDANAQIHTRGQASQDFKGMGTTCTALLLLPKGAMLAHAGDSRGYRLRGNCLEQLTFDHSLVWEMRRAGQITDDVIPGFISKNIITRSLGPNPTVQVDMEGPFPLALGDTFLLCTDGLTGQVQDDEIGAILAVLSPDEAVQALVDLANLRGGPDNITVVVARVTGPQVLPGATIEPNQPNLRAQKDTKHPWYWLTVYILMMLALLSWLLQLMVPALDFLVIPTLVFLGAAVAVGVAAVARRLNILYKRRRARLRRGQAPYSSCDCEPNAQLVQRFKEIVEQLHEAAKKEHWNIDWNRFHAQINQAAAATGAARYADAVREYLRSISLVMAELRNQGSGNGPAPSQ